MRRSFHIFALALLIIAFQIAPTRGERHGELHAQAKPGAKARSTYQGPPWVGFMASRSTPVPLTIDKVLKESPASRAGLEPGDIIAEVDGTEIKGLRDLKLVLRTKEVGDTLEILYVRGEGDKETASLTLAPTPSPGELVASQLMGEEAPPFAFKAITASGEAKALSTLEGMRGKITVVEFWATWCKPCEPFKKELTAIAKRYPDDVHIVAMSTEPVETLSKYSARAALPYTIASDESEVVHDAYFARGLPLVILLDGEHRVRKVITGEDDPSLVSKSIKSLMKSAPKAEITP